MAVSNNNEVISLLKSLFDRFDALRKDVDTLKERKAHRSASISSREAEPSGSEDEQRDNSEPKRRAGSTSRSPRRRGRKYTARLAPAAPRGDGVESTRLAPAAPRGDG